MPGRWILLAVLLLSGCRQEPKTPDYQPPKPISTRFDRLGAALATIPNAESTTLYEGLPSVFWEPQLWEQELNTKRTIRLHGYLFYNDLLALKDKDGAQLTTLFSARNTFERYRSQKECGGYHADYCIEWKSGDVATRALVCLECGEVKLFAPQAELYCDLTEKAAARIKQVLNGYQKNRPTSAPSS